MAKTLGTVLKEGRRRRALTLRDVEQATGIRNGHISQIENDAIAKPEMAMLWELASLYGLDYVRLLKLAGYTSGEQSSSRQRQRLTVAMRAMGELSPKEQNDVLKYMAELKRGKARE